MFAGFLGKKKKKCFAMQQGGQLGNIYGCAWRKGLGSGEVVEDVNALCTLLTPDRGKSKKGFHM